MKNRTNQIIEEIDIESMKIVLKRELEGYEREEIPYMIKATRVLSYFLLRKNQTLSKRDKMDLQYISDCYHGEIIPANIDKKVIQTCLDLMAHKLKQCIGKNILEEIEDTIPEKTDVQYKNLDRIQKTAGKTSPPLEMKEQKTMKDTLPKFPGFIPMSSLAEVHLYTKKWGFNAQEKHRETQRASKSQERIKSLNNEIRNIDNTVSRNNIDVDDFKNQLPNTTITFIGGYKKPNKSEKIIYVKIEFSENLNKKELVFQGIINELKHNSKRNFIAFDTVDNAKDFLKEVISYA